MSIKNMKTILLSTPNICFGREIRKLILIMHEIIKLQIFSYPTVLKCVLGAQKNRLMKMVLLSAHNICLVEK